MGTEKENYANMIHRIQGKHINRKKKEKKRGSKLVDILHYNDAAIITMRRHGPKHTTCRILEY